MIKAVRGEEKNLIFGLSKLNLQKLQEGQPIYFNLKEIGLEDRTVLIFYGETEQDMKKSMADNGLLHPTKTNFIDKNAEKNN